MLLLLAMATGAAQPVNLTEGAVFLAPSPANQVVAAVTHDGVLYICYHDKAPVRVADSVVSWGVSWSPDGFSLAFLRNNRIVIARDNRLAWQSQRFTRPGYPVWVGNELVYTGDGFLFIGEERFPGFSLVATVSPNPKNRSVAYTDLEGKNLLVFDPLSGKTDTLFSDPEGLPIYGPQWSPDGGLILVSRAGPGFWLWDPLSRAAKLISPGEAPSWSPDGKYFVYQVSQDDGHSILSSEIYMVEVSSGKTEKLPGEPNRLLPRFGKAGIYYLTIEGKAGFFTID